AARWPIALRVCHDVCGARRRVDAADQVDQGGLARARRAHQRHEVAARDVEVDAVQDLDRLAAAPVALGDGADLDQVGHQVLSASLTASPPLSDAGGESTTRSPSRTPVSTWRAAPVARPSVTARRSTLPSAW